VTRRLIADLLSLAAWTRRQSQKFRFQTLAIPLNE
jgi:hypothetical protein